MKPKRSIQNPQRELFRVELVNIIDTGHPLVVLGGKINWSVFGEQLGATYNQVVGASGINTSQRRGVEPMDYLRDVLARLPGMTTKDDIAALAPANWAKTRTTAAFAA